MDAFLSGLPIGDIGAGGLLALVVILLMTGRLVPKSRVDEVRSDKDAVILDNKGTISALRHELREVLDQNTSLLRGARTTLHVVESLPGVDDRQPAEGDG